MRIVRRTFLLSLAISAGTATLNGYRIAFSVALITLSGCVDLSAVGDFAKESSLIVSNKAMLDDTAAQTLARECVSERVPTSNFVDPTSSEFKARLAVTNRARDALDGYMTVLGQLSAKDFGNVSSDFSTIGAALKSLKVTDPAVQAGLNASSALTNLLLDAAIRHDVKKLISASAVPVDQIAAYLEAQAQTTSNTYTQAIAVSNKCWNDLVEQTQEDKAFCSSSNLCKPVYLLSNRAHDADNASLNAKVAAADAAVAAFKKIRTDNAALVANVDHLAGKTLVEILKRDEPDLLTAIHNLKSL